MAMYMMENNNKRKKLWQSSIRGLIINVYRRHVILLFFLNDVCVCRIAHNAKESLPDETSNTKIRFIQSVSNNYVGPNPCVSFYCPSIAILVTILVIILIYFCCLSYL